MSNARPVQTKNRFLKKGVYHLNMVGNPLPNEEKLQYFPVGVAAFDTGSFNLPLHFLVRLGIGYSSCLRGEGGGSEMEPAPVSLSDSES